MQTSVTTVTNQEKYLRMLWITRQTGIWGYQEIQNESYPKLVGVERNHVNSHSATSIASDRRSHVSGGVLGRSSAKIIDTVLFRLMETKWHLFWGRKWRYNISNETRRRRAQLSLRKKQTHKNWSTGYFQRSH